MFSNFQEEISLLKIHLGEVESQIATKSEECSSWFKEKESLLAKIKCIEDKLNLKELELENSILNSHEYVVTIKNVKNDNGVLTLENEKLQVNINLFINFISLFYALCSLPYLYQTLLCKVEGSNIIKVFSRFISPPGFLFIYLSIFEDTSHYLKIIYKN